MGRLPSTLDGVCYPFSEDDQHREEGREYKYHIKESGVGETSATLNEVPA